MAVFFQFPEAAAVAAAAPTSTTVSLTFLLLIRPVTASLRACAMETPSRLRYSLWMRINMKMSIAATSPAKIPITKQIMANAMFLLVPL